LRILITNKVISDSHEMNKSSSKGNTQTFRGKQGRSSNHLSFLQWEEP